MSRAFTPSWGLGGIANIMADDINVHRRKSRKNHAAASRRVVFWGVGATIFLMVLVALAATAIQKQLREEEIRQHETDQNKVSERYTLALRLQAACRKAIEQSIAPVLVLNWQTTSSPLTDWKDIESFSDTTTGNKMKLIADVGGRSLGYVCYLDKSAHVIQIVQGGY